MDHRDEATPSLDPYIRRSAERIARDQRNMNAVLSAMANQMSERLPTVAVSETALARRRTPQRWRIMVPLAAAAAIAALLLLRGGKPENGGESLILPPASRVPSMVSEMDVEADRPFAVFPTSDPDIAVVWLLNPKESD